MSDAAYFRAEARRFLDWSAMAVDPDVARRWRRLAEDYVTLAETLDAAETGRPPFLQPVQRQPIQQQQGKLGADEPAEC